MTKLTFADGKPVWVNPNLVVSVKENYGRADESIVSFVADGVAGSGYIVKGAPVDIANQLRMERGW